MTRVVAGSCVCLVLRQLQLHLETIPCWLLTSSWSSFSQTPLSTLELILTISHFF